MTAVRTPADAPSRELPSAGGAGARGTPRARQRWSRSPRPTGAARAAASPPPPAPARRRRRPGTAGRLAVFHALVLAIVLGVVVAALVRQFSSSYEGLAARGLSGEMQSFAAQPLPAGGSLLVTAAAYFRNHDLPAGTVVAVGDRSGQYVATGDWAGAFVADPRVRRDLGSPPASSAASATHVGGRDAELLVAPIVVGGRVVGTFVAAGDLAAFRADRSRVLALSLAEAGVALLAGVLSTFLLLRRLLRTVGRITTTAGAIGQGQVDSRLGDQGTDDEVGQLARTLDGMLDRIEGAMTAQRRLLSDVSHQLRTPLTIARGHLEVLQRTGLDDAGAVDETVSLVVEELDHMRSLVERLLLLGRVMEPDFVAPEPIDLRSFLADVDAASRVLAERDFQLPAIPDVVVRFDASKLRGALLNLVDNAVRATRPGDTIKLSAQLEGGSGDLVLAVDDSGPGIPPGSRAALLRRFERSGPADGGQGLGLAIVKAVAEAHGGSVAILTSPLGGCRVAVTLPAALVLGRPGPAALPGAGARL